MTQSTGFLFCACPDAALLRLYVDELVASAVHGRQHERQVYWGDEELPPRFWEALTLQSFLPTLRVLVLRNAQNIPAEVWKRLSKNLSKPNPQTLPVFCMEGPWEKNQPKILAHIAKLPCMVFAMEKGWFKTRPGLDAGTLKRHVQTLLRGLELVPEPGVLDALCAVLPANAAAIENELEKLALYAAARRSSNDQPLLLLPSDVELLAQEPDFNIFTLIRQLQAGQASQVWQTVLREQSKGEELIFPLLGLLQREARLCWQVLHNDTSRLFPRDVESRRDPCRRLGVAGLVGLWDAMHNAELSIKTGRQSPSQTLDTLIGELSLLFAPKGR